MRFTDEVLAEKREMVSSERAALMYTLHMERNYIGALVEGFDSTGEFKRPVNALVSPRPRPFPASSLPPSFTPFLILSLSPHSLWCTLPPSATSVTAAPEFWSFLTLAQGETYSLGRGIFALTCAPMGYSPAKICAPALFCVL
jgi:hypothetical protein